MYRFQIRRTVVAAAGLAIVGGGLLGAGIATASGDTTAPRPGPPMVCGTTGIDGKPARAVPCGQVPAGAISVTMDASGDIRDATGTVIGHINPKTGKVTAVAPTGPRN